MRTRCVRMECAQFPRDTPPLVCFVFVRKTVGNSGDFATSPLPCVLPHLPPSRAHSCPIMSFLAAFCAFVFNPRCSVFSPPPLLSQFSSSPLLCQFSTLFALSLSSHRLCSVNSHPLCSMFSYTLCPLASLSALSLTPFICAPTPRMPSRHLFSAIPSPLLPALLFGFSSTLPPRPL